ncbi:hypothetical protein [Tenacibaculum singaporense]|uniref:hypothetical protein n=1 Tax=Tenacibaculum singaporense TaxID=2358479 RepID=UPI000F677034|nr:hypothetical protein [Tenacibaculum singaporense]RSC94029.1 hypothetical protein EI424_08500 [Tenacibaculum singaporense]
MNKKIILIILFFNFFYISFSQHKKIIYVDENYKTIDFITYSKKLDSKLFDIAIASNDTATFKKLRFSEFYGNLNSKVKNQFKKIINKRYKIDTTNIWLIHYIDTIPNIKKMPKESGIEFLDSLNNPTGIFLNNKEFKKKKSHPFKRHKHITSSKDYINRIKQERKRVNKKVNLIHFYNFNKGFPIKTLNSLGYYKDYNNLVSKLFNDKMKMFSVIILYPSGDFYTSKHYYGSSLKEKKLLKTRYFNNQKEKWLNTINKLN